MRRWTTTGVCTLGLLLLVGLGAAPAQNEADDGVEVLWRVSASLTASTFTQGEVSVQGQDATGDGLLDRIRAQGTLDRDNDGSREVRIQVETEAASRGLGADITVERFGEDPESVAERITVALRSTSSGEAHWRPADVRRATVTREPNAETATTVEFERPMLEPFSGAVAETLDRLAEEAWTLATQHFEANAFRASAILWTLSGYLNWANVDLDRAVTALSSARTDFSFQGPFPASRAVGTIVATVRPLLEADDGGGSGAGEEPVITP